MGFCFKTVELHMHDTPAGEAGIEMPVSDRVFQQFVGVYSVPEDLRIAGPLHGVEGDGA
jgi:hypothetical protein